jgi:hypothetical protein
MICNRSASVGNDQAAKSGVCFTCIPLLRHSSSRFNVLSFADTNVEDKLWSAVSVRSFGKTSLRIDFGRLLFCKLHVSDKATLEMSSRYILA